MYRIKINAPRAENQNIIMLKCNVYILRASTPFVASANATPDIIAIPIVLIYDSDIDMP